MVNGTALRDKTRAETVHDWLQQVDYRVANLKTDRNDIFRLRYRAYLNEGSISSNPEKMFSDDYDAMDNCWIFGLFHEDWLISSIRFHAINKQNRYGPALDVFPDLVGPMIDAGQTIIDPTRFVVDDEATKMFPDLPFLTLRVATMASEFFDADHCLATVRAEHRAFYRRVFESKQLCDPRPYPTLTQPICLMTADVRGIREKLMRRYPVFLSSFTERKMLMSEFVMPTEIGQNDNMQPYVQKVSGFS